MKAMIVYLAALGGGAAVGAVGVGSWNVYLGEGVVVEDHVAGSDSTELTTMVDAGEASGAGRSPVDAPDETPLESAGEASQDDDARGAETLPVEGGSATASVADGSTDAASQETEAPFPVPQTVPALDADSLARVTQNYSRLARIFAAMKPAEAAPVLAQLEDAQLEGVLLAMQGRNAAPILAEMDPARAAAISRRVLGGNQ